MRPSQTLLCVGLAAVVLSACETYGGGSTGQRSGNGNVAEQKTERQSQRQQQRVENRVDREADQAADSFIDRIMDSIFD